MVYPLTNEARQDVRLHCIPARISLFTRARFPNLRGRSRPIIVTSDYHVSRKMQLAVVLTWKNARVHIPMYAIRERMRECVA